MKLHEQLRRAAGEISPGVPGQNPHAALLLQAMRAIESNADRADLEFLQDHCDLRFTHGASQVVNPIDLRRAIADVRSDRDMADFDVIAEPKANRRIRYAA